jgi:hypothetical protein
MYSATGRILLQRPMRPVSVVMTGVLAQDQPQVPLTGNQHLVEALTASAGNPPPFSNRVARIVNYTRSA